MASRRLPLSAVPNAVNSPIRNVPAINGKRTRTQAGEQHGLYGQPPAKKHVVELSAGNEENVDPRRRVGVSALGLDKLEEPFLKRNSHAPPTAFEKKLASVREKRTTPQHTQQPREGRSQKQHADNIESIRQWQKHYRRQFPGFVFYFDSVSDEVRLKAVRKIHALGAREDKFFSNAVTHVVTSRSIPSETTNAGTDYDENEAMRQRSIQQLVSHANQRRPTSALDAHIQRRSQLSLASVQPSIETRRTQSHSADILSKARGLGTKIWALEKLHRVLDTIMDTDPGDHAADSRGAAVNRVSSRNVRDADLEQLLRHEKVKGPTDRDMTVATHDVITLRGCYIYVHDMDEKTKPVMVRDYSKPQSKDQGKWPQFRLSAPGRCPFIDDPAYAKKMVQQDREALEPRDMLQRKTRAGVSSQLVPPLVANAGFETALRRSPRKLAQSNMNAMTQPPPPPYPGVSRRQESVEAFAPFYNSAQANMRGPPRMVRGEPVASGVQPSNVTSAIRSQAVSSAAISSTTGLNRRVGDSREMSMLKRKVLTSNSIPTSYANDVRAAINDDSAPPPRAAKRKAQETLGVVYENGNGGDPAQQVPAMKRKKTVEKEPKPGYCENCRDKFDDFDDVSTARLWVIHDTDMFGSTLPLGNTESSPQQRRIGKSSTSFWQYSSGHTRNVSRVGMADDRNSELSKRQQPRQEHAYEMASCTSQAA